MKIQSVKAVLSLNYAEMHEHTLTPAQRGKKLLKLMTLQAHIPETVAGESDLLTVVLMSTLSHAQPVCWLQDVITIPCQNSSPAFLWSPYVIGQTIIFSSCFFFFLLSSSFFFSSPNLSGRRLDVYHTLAHGVALVQI